MLKAEVLSIDTLFADGVFVVSSIRLGVRTLPVGAETLVRVQYAVQIGDVAQVGRFMCYVKCT